jgi:hypothetical protein
MKPLTAWALRAPACAFGPVYPCTDAKAKLVFQGSACGANRGADPVQRDVARTP